MVTLERSLCGEDLFDNLDREKEEKVSCFKVKTTPTLEEICKKYSAFISSEKVDEYLDALNIIRKSYDARDILLFSIALPDYKSRTANFSGFFLSALANLSKNKKIVLNTHRFENIKYIGYKNRKHHIINGNGGEILGYGMSDGIIELFGNAGGGLGGDMSGGAIHNYGDVGDMIGMGMQGGEIHIHGEAGEKIGTRAIKGNIFLEGNYKSIGDYYLNSEINIYHKGRLIVKDGRRIE